MNEITCLSRILILIGLCGFLASCAANRAELPYPAFIVVDELPDVYIAGLPGVRAKQLAGNPQTRRSSNKISLPSEWQFTTGAAPGLSVEIYVLAGDLSLGGLPLTPGSYAYVPPGSTGMQMKTTGGATILYFLDDADEKAVIQTPLIADSKLLDWQPLSDRTEDIGILVKELRLDPGSGARTWLLKIDPIATQSLRRSSTTNEGYLLSGTYQTSECVMGEVVTDIYSPGGYFHRPPGATHGGSEEMATQTSVWFMRVLEPDTVVETRICAGVTENEEVAAESG